MLSVKNVFFEFVEPLSLTYRENAASFLTSILEEVGVSGFLKRTEGSLRTLSEVSSN